MATRVGFKRVVLTALAACVVSSCLSSLCIAQDAAIIYEDPRIPAGTPAYDAETPENLIEDQLYARSAILIEADSGEVIFEKNADTLMYPASTTKILTTLLALQSGDMNDTVTISANAMDLPPNSSNARFKAGEEVNLEQLLYATMIMSANEGATAVAEHISGSVTAFADYMNRAAVAFGCTQTHFTNANGLHDPYHYTTARDMALIAREAMDNDRFRQICAATSYTLEKTNLQKSRSLSGRNLFLSNTEDNRYYYQDGNGIKTGYTNAAGNCFVGSASRNGVNLISVVFYSGDRGRYADSIKLMNYGFSQYIGVTLIELYQMNPITIDSTNFSLKDSNVGRLTLYARAVDNAVPATITVKRNELESLTRNFRRMVILNYTRDFSAPIAAGEVFGTMTYVPEIGGAIEYELIAARSISARENAPKSIEQIERETYEDPNPFPPLSLELVIILSWPLLLFIVLLVLLIKLIKGRRIRRTKIPDPIGRRYH